MQVCGALPGQNVLQEFQRRAGYVSARISPSIATHQGIYIPRAPSVHAIGVGSICSQQDSNGTGSCYPTSVRQLAEGSGRRQREEV